MTGSAIHKPRFVGGERGIIYNRTVPYRKAPPCADRNADARFRQVYPARRRDLAEFDELFEQVGRVDHGIDRLPFLRRFIISTVGAQVVTTVCPVARSNSGTSST